MTYNEFVTVIENDVARIIQENRENVLNGIVSGLPTDTPCITKEQLIMCQNAVNYSVQASVRIILDYLDSLGMLNYEVLQEHHEPPVLKVLKGGLDIETTED